MNDPSAGEIGGLFAGAVALLTVFGGGFRWLVGWSDRRAETRTRKLEAWEASLAMREKDYREKIEGQLSTLAHWSEQLQRQQRALLSAYQTIAGALRRVAPADPALRLADELLKAAFPLDEDMPADFRILLSDLDDADI